MEYNINIFDIDTDMVLNNVMESLESAANKVTEDQFLKISETIDDALPGVIQTLAQGISEYWRLMARKEHAWGNKYARAITYKVTGTEAEIYLDKDSMDMESDKPNIMFALMVEEGVKPWSIKKALLESEKAKMSSEGYKYIVVPFPVSTPRRKNQGRMQPKFGRREMSREMYNVVKSGGRLKSGTIKAGEREVNVTGLTKYNTRKLHGQYGIFRIASDKPGTSEWKHPGSGRQPVYPSVLQEVNKQISSLLRDFCMDIVKEYSD